MIANEEEEGWYYLAVKKLSAWLERITSKHNGDFYCLICFHYFRKKNNLNLIKYVKIKIFCGMAMPSEKDNILKSNKYMKSVEMPDIINANFNLWLKR